MGTGDRPKFVTDLLKKSNAERLRAFEGYTTKHPLLMQTYEELRCTIRDSSPGSIIYTYGPPGVGKTTLLKRIEEHLKGAMLAELSKNPGLLPVIRVRAPTPMSGNFDWLDFLKRLLIALEEPLVDRKIDMERWQRLDSSTTNNSRTNRKLISEDRPGMRPLRFAYEQTLRHRRPIAVLIDDAQHLGILSSGRKMLNQLNIIKSISDESLVTHILCGTYEIIPFRNLSGQLSRRSINIHFGRYNAEDQAQRQEFINVLYTFQEHLPLPEVPDLVAKWDYFYERSIGCIGVLKDWLIRSLSLALESNSHSLPFKIVERRALSVSQCSSMLREAIAGEKESEEREDARVLLRKTMGLPAEDITLNREFLVASDLSKKAASPAKFGQRVGTRKPVRDSIGRKAE